MIIKTKQLCLLNLDRARPKNVKSAKDLIRIRLLLIYDRRILQLRLCKLLHTYLLLVRKIAYSSIFFVGECRCRLHSLIVCLFGGTCTYITNIKQKVQEYTLTCPALTGCLFVCLF